MARLCGWLAPAFRDTLKATRTSNATRTLNATRTFTSRVHRSLADDPGWDTLVSDARPSSIFMTSAVLSAWADTRPGAELLVVSVDGPDDSGPAAAAAFELEERSLRFAGQGVCDYADLMVSSRLDDAEAVQALRLLFSTATQAAPGARRFDLRRIPWDSRALTLLPRCGLFVTTRPGVAAPCMDMSVAAERLRKKSLVRHERGLQRRGELIASTYRASADVQPRLPAFFDLHVKRWQDTDSPSLFLDPGKRRLYQQMAQRLDSADALRYTELHLDGHLLAAHFGFCWQNRFTWYKPCFDPAFAKLSPGEVLLKRLIEQALEEGATCFDFTIGDEAFKHRFATSVPRVVNAHVTRSPWQAGLRRARSAARALTSRL